MFTLLGFLAALPLMAIVAAWLEFIKRLPPREQELAKASHGLALMVVPVLLYSALFDIQDIGSFLRAVVADGGNDPGLWVPALLWAAITIFGLFWLVIGGSRGRGPFDARLFTRALVKIGLGVAAWVIGQGDKLPPDWVAGGFTNLALMVIGLWCLVTGLAKMLLLLVGGGSAARKIRRHIASKNQPLRPARRRTF